MTASELVCTTKQAPLHRVPLLQEDGIKALLHLAKTSTKALANMVAALLLNRTVIGTSITLGGTHSSECS